jgi:hypothetical protein
MTQTNDQDGTLDKGNTTNKDGRAGHMRDAFENSDFMAVKVC